MLLTAGDRLGSYDILSALGAGGMGEVYHARDTRLARDVALKILPESLSVDAERLARFRREAQVLAGHYVARNIMHYTETCIVAAGARSLSRVAEREAS